MTLRMCIYKSGSSEFDELEHIVEIDTTHKGNLPKVFVDCLLSYMKPNMDRSDYRVVITRCNTLPK